MCLIHVTLKFMLILALVLVLEIIINKHPMRTNLYLVKYYLST